MARRVMSNEMPFQVLPGGRQVGDSIAGLRVVIARDDDPPFGIDAEAFEEDSWLALSADIDIAVAAQPHPLRVMTQAWDARPRPIGVVVVQKGIPLRLLAVVHDLNSEPSWTEETVREALESIFLEARRHGITSLKLPMIGSKYGTLAAARFMELLAVAIHAHQDPEDSRLQRLWIVRESESGEELLSLLRHRA